LAYRISLSRPRSLSRLLSHGLPDRDIIEGCPLKVITDAFEELLKSKITSTKLACACSRAEMSRPARVDLLFSLPQMLVSLRLTHRCF
jgi:hypothetical protein